jgi:putative phosphoribosyl transferase
MPFTDRRDAGKQLAARLTHYRDAAPIILALPRGGVPVAHEVARALRAPLDVLVVRKLGVPWQPELGFGAVTEGEIAYVDQNMCGLLGLGDEQIEEITKRKRKEVETRVRRFRGNIPPPTLRDRTVIIVDDGVATGGTARAAIQAVREQAPRRIIFAAPVAAAQAAIRLSALVDECVCVETPEDLWAIGAWYEDFEQVSDGEVAAILALARTEPVAATERVPSAR